MKSFLILAILALPASLFAQLVSFWTVSYNDGGVIKQSPWFLTKDQLIVFMEENEDKLLTYEYFDAATQRTFTRVRGIYQGVWKEFHAIEVEPEEPFTLEEDGEKAYLIQYSRDGTTKTETFTEQEAKDLRAEAETNTQLALIWSERIFFGQPYIAKINLGTVTYEIQDSPEP